jgi:hypothetical protein
MVVIVFHRLAETRMCPKCIGPLKLYVTEEGIRLLACMNCGFDVADQQSNELALSQVRQMAARDRREHSKQKKRVIKESDV